MLLFSGGGFWQIFRDSYQSKKHILIIDPYTWALVLDDFECTIVVYKGDLKYNFFDFEVGRATLVYLLDLAAFSKSTPSPPLPFFFKRKGKGFVL